MFILILLVFKNVSLGLCSDGLTPFSNVVLPYSFLQVFHTPYNLSPEICRVSPYISLSCVIPGPRNLKRQIDVYLYSLRDELKQLWFEGVLTYDKSTKQNFVMHTSLMWNINDFFAYRMLSVQMMARNLACLYCMENSKAFTLKYRRKNAWFDCHRQFFCLDYQFRKTKCVLEK